MKTGRMDTRLVTSVVLLVTAGLLIFLSASLGLLARDTEYSTSIVFKQIFFGFVPGIALMYGMSRMNYAIWKKLSFYLFVLAIGLNLAIFIPGFGLSHGGATRWLLIGSFSFQVSEVLKIAAIIYFAAWLSSAKERIGDFKYGLLPLLVILSIVAGLLLIQPDTDTLVVIGVSLVAMYLVAGGKWRDIIILALIGSIALSILVTTRPYLKSRIESFLNPSAESLGQGYQLQQSLIAIGSGGVTGKGFGQSVQKFGFLPEPVGDSIFAVAAEEFGFVGSVVLIFLFVFFGVRSLKIAQGASSLFGVLLATGIVTFILAQSFINISAMLGILPLSGIPLLFVSQGGTALLFALFEVGILLNISRSARLAR